MSGPRCTCGVYETAHVEGRGCGDYRRASALRLWLIDHSPWRHVVGSAWLALPEKWRWSVVGRIHDRRPDLCWCDLVDCAQLDAKKDDFRGHWGCGCDVPLPIHNRRPDYGSCYCQPPVGWVA